MKQVLVVLALALVAGCGLLPDITQSVDVNQRQDVRNFFDAGCQCMRDRDTGAIAVDDAIILSVAVSASGSSFTATVAGGSPPFRLLVDGVEIAGAFVQDSRTSISINNGSGVPAGTHTVQVIDSRGLASEAVTVTLTS